MATKDPKKQISAASLLITTDVAAGTAHGKINKRAEQDAAFQRMMAGITDPDSVEQRKAQDRFVTLSILGIGEFDQNSGDVSVPNFTLPYEIPPTIGDKAYTTRQELASGIDRLSYIGAIAKGKVKPDKDYVMDFAGFPSGAFSGTWSKISSQPIKVDRNFSLDGSFQQAFQIVLASEGGFSNHKADKGGATIYGIASKSNPVEYAQIMDQLGRGDKAGAMQTAMTTYKTKYWDSVSGINQLSPSAKLVAFDAAINHGVGFSNKMVSATRGDADDMLAYRAQKYASIIENDQSQAVFAKGWGNRLAKLDTLTTVSEKNMKSPPLLVGIKDPAPL